MKKIIIALAALLCAAAFNSQAQVLPDYSKQVKIFRGDFYADDVKLTSDEAIRAVLGDEIFQEGFVGARRQRRVGLGLTIAGGATTLVGGGMGLAGIIMHWAPQEITKDTKQQAELKKIGKEYCIWGLATAVTGAALLGVGVPFLVIGKTRLDAIESNFNKKHTATLSFNGTENGVGLALRF